MLLSSIEFRQYFTVTVLVIENGVIDNRSAMSVPYFANINVDNYYPITSVILAASGMFTPHLIMFFGIGLREHLIAAKITLKKRLVSGWFKLSRVPGAVHAFQSFKPSYTQP